MMLRPLLFSLCLAFCAGNAAAADSFSFAVSGSTITSAGDETTLQRIINETDADNLAFVAITGIKASAEPCSDELYERRKNMLNHAKNAVMPILSGNDWSTCQHANGSSAAFERLTHLRELLFNDEFSLGETRLLVVRQSTLIKYRNYAENLRWEINNIIFDTLNIPQNNNHYVIAAGRNSEFEDRLVANRDWLQRTVAIASHKNARAIVLLMEGDVLAVPEASAQRDGFHEIRKLMLQLAKKFPGKILLVHPAAQAHSKKFKLIWQNNLADLSVAENWVKITVSPAADGVFQVKENPSGG